MAPPPPPRLTYAIAAVTALAWLLAALAGASDFAAVQGGFIPARAYGATGFVVPYGLTPLTATLVHGGLLHLVLNLTTFAFCGRETERAIGWKALAVLYVAGAYAATSGQYFAGPLSTVPMVGASGAISAVVAVYALLFSNSQVKRIGPVPERWVRALWLAAAWIGLQWLMQAATAGTAYGVATAAHVGGFLAGIVFAPALVWWRYR